MSSELLTNIGELTLTKTPFRAAVTIHPFWLFGDREKLILPYPPAQDDRGR